MESIGWSEVNTVWYFYFSHPFYFMPLGRFRLHFIFVFSVSQPLDEQKDTKGQIEFLVSCFLMYQFWKFVFI